MDPRELEIEKAWLLNARTDSEAFDVFYRKYYDRIFRFCHHRVADVEFAEDLVSEVFLQAQQNLWRFRWLGLTMGAWLFRIALNQVSYRMRNRLATTTLDPTDDRLAGEFDDPLVALALAEDEYRIRRLVADLDPDYRETLRLHYWDDLTVREIGAVLGCPVGTIKARLKRGRDRLEEMFAAEERADAPREGRPSPDDLP